MPDRTARPFPTQMPLVVPHRSGRIDEGKKILRLSSLHVDGDDGRDDNNNLRGRLRVLKTADAFVEGLTDPARGSQRVARRPARGMSLIATVLKVLRSRSELVGPGRLVLVVGPSGAGKDTLIAGARAACRDDGTVVFPLRVVTRPASPFEDNDFLSQSAFEQAAAKGAFAFWWSAHGHDYGIPLAIDFDIEMGRTVVCNVSRTVVDAVRRRYAHVVTVLVTAPKDVLASRLAARDRASDGRIAERLDRGGVSDGTCRPDVIINNVDEPERGVRKLLDAVYANGVLAG